MPEEAAPSSRNIVEGLAGLEEPYSVEVSFSVSRSPLSPLSCTFDSRSAASRFALRNISVTLSTICVKFGRLPGNLRETQNQSRAYTPSGRVTGESKCTRANGACGLAVDRVLVPAVLDELLQLFWSLSELG